MSDHTILHGHVITRLQELPDSSIDCVVTSPPYYQLRDYQLEPVLWDAVSYAPMAGIPPIEIPAMVCCLGLESDPLAFVGHIVAVFREVRRVLKKSGTCWVNFGDGYVGGGRGGDAGSTLQGTHRGREKGRVTDMRGKETTLPPKNLIGMPWRVTLALQADGWILRRDVIWHKPQCMPESCRDRPTTAHEYIFLLTKSPTYYWDFDAVAEPTAADTHARLGRSHAGYKAPGQPEHSGVAGFREAAPKPDGGLIEEARSLGEKSSVAGDEVKSSASARMGRGAGWREALKPKGELFDGERAPGVNPKAAKIPGPNPRVHVTRNGVAAPQSRQNESFSAAVVGLVETRNIRSVWTIGNGGTSLNHYATYPERIPELCILAGCPVGGTVLDPFYGSGTTGAVAKRLGRKSVGVDANADYVAMAIRRLADVNEPLPMEVA